MKAMLILTGLATAAVTGAAIVLPDPAKDGPTARAVQFEDLKHRGTQEQSAALLVDAEAQVFHPIERNIQRSTHTQIENDETRQMLRLLHGN